MDFFILLQNIRVFTEKSFELTVNSLIKVVNVSELILFLYKYKIKYWFLLFQVLSAEDYRNNMTTFILIDNTTNKTYICCKDALFNIGKNTAIEIVDYYFKIVKALHVNLTDLNVGVKNFLEFLELYVYNFENPSCKATDSMTKIFETLTNI